MPDPAAWYRSPWHSTEIDERRTPVTSLSDAATTADVAKWVAELNDDEERAVEKVLVRAVSDKMYACQVWRTGDRDPESYFLHLE